MKRMFSNDPEAETCDPLSSWKEMLDSPFSWNNLHRIELWEWEKCKGNNFFWCQVDGEGYESGTGVCGQECASYDPRNRKSGRCRFHAPCWYPTNKKFILTHKGLAEAKT